MQQHIGQCPFPQTLVDDKLQDLLIQINILHFCRNRLRAKLEKQQPVLGHELLLMFALALRRSHPIAGSRML